MESRFSEYVLVGTAYWQVNLFPLSFVVPLRVFETLTLAVGRYPEVRLTRAAQFVGRHSGNFGDRETEAVIRRLDQYRSSASICDVTARCLWHHLWTTAPRHIIELGAGLSTLILAAYARKRLELFNDKVTVLSVDNSKDWIEKHQSVLDNLGLARYVRLVWSDLDRCHYYGEDVICYSSLTESFVDGALGGRPDMAFVDGPIGVRFGGVGRRGSIRQAASLARPGAKLMVHDAFRSEEFTHLRELHHTPGAGFTFQGIAPFHAGLAICRKLHDSPQPASRPGHIPASPEGQ